MREVVVHIYDVTNSGSDKTNTTIMQIKKFFKDGIGLGGIFHSAVQFLETSKMLETQLCPARVLSPFREESGDEELYVLPRHTTVIVIGNNRTKSVLLGLQGVCQEGRWAWWLALAVTLQRNALSVLEPATGDEEDDDYDFDDSSSGSNIVEKENHHFGAVPYSTTFGTSRTTYSSLHSFPQQKKYNIGYGDNSFYRQCRSLRHIIARSELANASSAGAAYPLSELELTSKVRGICFYAVTAFSAIVLFVVMLVQHPLVLLFDRHCRKAHHLVAKTEKDVVVPLFPLMFPSKYDIS